MEEHSINIFCGGIQPPKFTAEQIAECQSGCKWASGKKRFCGRFGCFIREGQGRIIQPDKRIRIPTIKQQKPCNEKNFETAYEKAKGMYAGYKPMGGEVIDLITKAEYIARRTKCALCLDKNNCPMRGCTHWQKVIHRNWKCPKDK